MVLVLGKATNHAGEVFDVERELFAETLLTHEACHTYGEAGEFRQHKDVGFLGRRRGAPERQNAQKNSRAKKKKDRFTLRAASERASKHVPTQTAVGVTH